MENIIAIPDTIDDFCAHAVPFIERFNAFTQKHALVDRARADHLCYKCDSHISFEAMRAMLEPHCAYLYQSYISGRRIAYLKFSNGIVTDLGVVNFLELSDQKPDGSQVNQYDHIEVYPTAMSYEEFVRDLAETENLIKVERPHHTTHDIEIGGNFIFRCTRGPLIEKIRANEMG